MDVEAEIREFAEGCDDVDAYGTWRYIEQGTLLTWANQLRQDKKTNPLPELSTEELRELKARLIDLTLEAQKELKKRSS